MKKSEMGKPHREQRRAALLRLALAALVLALQVALTVAAAYLLRHRAAIVYTVLEVVGLLMAVRIYNRPGSSVYKLSWILLVLFVPVAGLILYWLWSGDRQSKRLSLKGLPMLRESEARQEKSRLNVEKLRRSGGPWGRLASYLHKMGFPLYQNTSVTYFSTGESMLEDLLARTAQAEHFVFMEFFIVAEGEIWRKLKAILLEKAAKGVEIKLLLDDFGSMHRLRPTELAELRHAGVEVRIFNPVHRYVSRLYFNYRDHRKIVVLDGNTAYTGGVNIADEYANFINRFGYWKDCGVRLDGEGAWGLCREFIHMWENVGGHMEQEKDYYRPDESGENAGFCQTISDGPDNNPTATAEDVFLQLIAGAQSMVSIATPYLAIDEAMCKALCLAGDSGVDVRLLMPGVPDKKIAYLVAESYFGELLSHGVKIYSYTPGFVHSKLVLSDRRAAFVGSVNMDYRSFQLHFECGTVLYDVPAIENIFEDMDDIAAHSTPVTLEQWKRRPALRRGLGPLLRLFAGWI